MRLWIIRLHCVSLTILRSDLYNPTMDASEYHFFTLWLQRTNPTSSQHPGCQFFVHNAAAIQARPNSTYTIFYDGFQGWPESSIREYFFGAGGDGFPKLQHLRSAVGDLFWNNQCEPLLQHHKYTQNTNADLKVERAQASKVTDQCRFFILRQMAFFSNDSTPIVVYLDADVVVNPRFWHVYPLFRGQSSYRTNTRHFYGGLLISTYGRGGPGSMQIDHFTGKAWIGGYRVKDLALNASVLLFDPKYADRDKDFKILDALAEGYGSDLQRVAGGKTVEWTAGMRAAAQLLSDLPFPAGLAPPYLFHPISTKETKKNIINDIQDSMIVSLSGNLDARYGQQVIDYFSQKSNIVAAPEKRIISSSCPEKLRGTWRNVINGGKLLDTEKQLLDIRESAKEAGHRSGLKSMNLRGLEMVHKRLGQRIDKKKNRKTVKK